MLNASERRLFKALAPEFLSWRRSSLLHVAQWSSRRRSAIRKAWSAKAFKTGGQQTDGGANGVINHDGGDDLEAQETGVDKDLKQLDAIIRDPVTWARLEALAQLALIPESLTQWGQDCPCHPGLEGSSSALRRVLDSAGLLRDSDAHDIRCPVRSMRAPELALGDHMSVVRRATAQSLTNLLTVLPSIDGLQQADIDAIVAEIGLACDKVAANLQIKTAFADALPFGLCGMAHLQASRGRQAARHLLERFDRQPQGHDIVSQAWLSPTLPGSLRADVVQFAQTGDQTLRLQSWLARLAFIPLSERKAEEPHRLVKVKIAFTPARGLLASLSMRNREICKMLENDSFESHLLKCMDSARSPDVIAQLGLQWHPVFVRLASHSLQSMRRGRKWSDALTAVLFKHDADTKYLEQTLARQTHEAGRIAEKREDQRLKPRLRQKATVNTLLARHWVDHLRATVPEGSILQLPARLAGSAIRGLADRLHRCDPIGQPEPEPGNPDELAEDLPSLAELPRMNLHAGGQMYVRMLHTDPARFKTVPV